MKKLFAITLQLPTGGMRNYNVVALDPIADTPGNDSAFTKAKAKLVSDEGIENATFQSFSTLGQIDIA